MSHYRDALSHLNSALDAMILQGDTCIVANIALPIALVEQAILAEQVRICTAAYGAADSSS